jgi:hypothetical protein
MLADEFGILTHCSKSSLNLELRNAGEKTAILNGLFLATREIRTPIGGESCTGSRWNSGRGGDDLNGVATGL